MALAIIFSIACTNSYAQSEIKITQDSLPAIIKQELKKKYSGYAVNEVMLLTEKTKSVIYKIELQKKNNLVRLEYDVAGTLISKSKSKIYSFDGTEKPRRLKPSENNDGHNHQH